MRLHFIPIHVFRETPAVTFFDAGVPDTNSTDIVAHHGAAMSPPNDENFEQFYVHYHQIDHNLVLNGHRTFKLLNPNWTKPRHVVVLERIMGALQIPIGTYHRSISGEEGSTVLNQSIRDDDFDFHNEFIPVSLRDQPELQTILETPPCIWRWRNGHIQRRFRMKT